MKGEIMQVLRDIAVTSVESDAEVLQDWFSLQSDLLSFMSTATPSLSYPWRHLVEAQIIHATGGRAQLYWEPFDIEQVAECDRFCEVAYQQTRYGFLGLVPGYLGSRLYPHIPQDFAKLCALLLRLSEFQLFIHYQTSGLLPLLPVGQVGKLTKREREVLLGLIKGESDDEISEVLGIEPTTVHTHRKHLYQRLDVHSAQEAALRCFTQRVVDWLNGPLIRY